MCAKSVERPGYGQYGHVVPTMAMRAREAMSRAGVARGARGEWDLAMARAGGLLGS